MRITLRLALAALLPSLALAAAEKPVTFQSLLLEMLDREAIARLPSPAYVCRQASSYERLSKSPKDPKGWFADHDWSHFLRSEQRGGRTEWVMLDAEIVGANPNAIQRYMLGLDYLKLEPVK